MSELLQAVNKMKTHDPQAQTPSKKRFSGFQVLLIILGVILATFVLTLFSVRYFLFAKPFEPVELSQQEAQRLDHKLDRLERSSGIALQDLAGGDESEQDEFTAEGRLKPEPYSEAGADREVHFSEREVNALLAHNTDLARRLAIDLSHDLVSARVLIPFDPDFPLLGAKTLRVKAGLELASLNGKPVVKLKGVSLMGVPLPKAWLGGLKGLDLVQTYGSEEGFWQAFSEGIEEMTVREGELVLRLRE